MTGVFLPIAAQAFGAGDFDRVRADLLTCWRLSGVMMLVACPLLLIALPLMMRVFTDDAEVIRIGVSNLRVDGLIMPFYVMLFSINSFLQALKKPIWPLWIGIYRQGFGIAFFSYWYVSVLGCGFIGVWMGIASSVISGFVVSLLLARHVSKGL